jgi:sirohydrochlorin ferrochelatase
VKETVGKLSVPGPVELSFLMGPEAARTRFQDAVDRVVKRGASHVVVVPLLVSSHSGHYEQVRYLAGKTDSLDQTMQEHLHHAGIHRASTDVPITVTPALDASRWLAVVLTERSRAMEPVPAGRALMLVGHGPNSAVDYAAWMKNLRPVADSVRLWSGFRSVQVELVREDATPAVREEAVQRLRDLVGLQAEVTGQPVTVVPILISRAGIARSRVLQDLAGLPIRYEGDPLLPHPAIASWIEASVRAASGR